MPCQLNRPFFSVIACGIIRLIIFQWVIELMSVDPMTFVLDATWYSAGVLFWHLAENVVGLIGCCLPTYRPFFKRYLPRLRLGSSNQSQPAGGGGGGTPAATKHSSSSRSRGSHYQRQHDGDWPVGPSAGVGVGVSADTLASTRGFDEEHALGELLPGQIVVCKEFRTHSVPRGSPV